MNTLLLFVLLLNPQESILEQGLRYEEAGNYAEALRTWERAFLEYEKPSFVIAREYIRVATKYQLKENYETASSMYFWGLADTTFREKDMAIYYEELEFLEPLMPNSVHKRFKELLDNKDSDLYGYMRGFWQQLDPTPGTLYNERLIEHWERIAHARSTFTKNNRGTYGADDRGEIFVRYGAPDKTFTGTILTSITEITNTCSTFGRCNQFIMAEVIRSNDPMPRYEIWVYDRPNRYMRDNLIYLFAETSTSRFKRFNTVEELIPPQFFTLSTSRYDFSSLVGSTDSGNMSPGMVLQWVYYNEFSSYDIFFGKRVSKMEQNWVTTPAKRAEQGPYQGQVLAQEIRNEFVHMKREAPTEKSKLTEELSEIPLQTFPYRFLDSGGNPYYALFLSSDIYEPIALDFILNRNANKLVAEDSTLLINELKNYDLFHGINIQKQNGELFSKSRRNIGIALDGDLNMKNQNVYQIPFTDEEKETVVYAELYGTHDPGFYDQDTPFDPTLKGIGKAIVELPDPLEWKEDDLILADIILGYDMDYELEQAFIPFTPSHDKTIPMNEVLAMHFEVYNLATNENGEGNFQFNYQVTKPRSFQWIRGRAQEVGLSATFTTIGGMFSEDIEIETRDLEVGKYTLEIEIKDLNSNKTITRDLDFEVVSTLLGKN